MDDRGEAMHRLGGPFVFNHERYGSLARGSWTRRVAQANDTWPEWYWAENAHPLFSMDGVKYVAFVTLRCPQAGHVMRLNPRVHRVNPWGLLVVVGTALTAQVVECPSCIADGWHDMATMRAVVLGGWEQAASEEERVAVTQPSEATSLRTS
jgi:hypothetical protein